MQRKYYALVPFVIMFLFAITSCEAIEGIFKAGVWSGLILVAVVVVIIIWIISRFRK